ncbi:MAG: hypothetical protein AMDU2_EPLC00006G0127 [Thermoplasmatales archaeon E-plasma]|jgi:hypothetical protein|nr:MAG: hypothetical protein AMDU2_EPLC00006G0127 [Thermoplasmatales archaeon E-plasma]
MMDFSVLFIAGFISDLLDTREHIFEIEVYRGINQ